MYGIDRCRGRGVGWGGRPPYKQKVSCQVPFPMTFIKQFASSVHTAVSLGRLLPCSLVRLLTSFRVFPCWRVRLFVAFTCWRVRLFPSPPLPETRLIQRQKGQGFRRRGRMSSGIYSYIYIEREMHTVNYGQHSNTWKFKFSEKPSNTKEGRRCSLLYIARACTAVRCFACVSHIRTLNERLLFTWRRYVTTVQGHSSGTAVCPEIDVCFVCFHACEAGKHHRKKVEKTQKTSFTAVLGLTFLVCSQPTPADARTCAEYGVC